MLRFIIEVKKNISFIKVIEDEIEIKYKREEYYSSEFNKNIIEWNIKDPCSNKFIKLSNFLSNLLEDKYQSYTSVENSKIQVL